MAQTYRRKNQAEPKSILQARKSTSTEDMTAEQAIALGGLLAAAVRNNNAVYIQPGRYGSLTFKVYIEGEQFAEALFLDNTLEDLCEQIVAALYTDDDVAWNRRAFAPRLATLAPAARNAAKPTQE